MQILMEEPVQNVNSIKTQLYLSTNMYYWTAFILNSNGGYIVQYYAINSAK